MDERTALNVGASLSFPGVTCRIAGMIGRGSNAMVYEGTYEDAATGGTHRVLIKELFPYDADGGIRREGDEIACAAAARALFEMHRQSFLRGNRVHLQLLSQQPEQVGGNINTFSLHGTLYTLLDFSGGRSMESELERPGLTLLTFAHWMEQMLLSLDSIHQSGLLHLDISPDNVLVIGQPPRERIMLIDYNSVYSLDELREGVTYLSAKDGYTAPEITTNDPSQIGPWTDLFAATCLFYRGLTGAAPTPMQLCRKKTPEFESSPLLRGASQTVCAQIRAILHRGLTLSVSRRYRCCAEMLADIRELIQRVEGVGVTHAALWEAGQRAIQQLIRQNPSLAYLREEEALYPMRAAADGLSFTGTDWLRALRADRPAVLTGAGGSGKSTLLMHTAFALSRDYLPTQPAVLYIALPTLQGDSPSPVLDAVLRLLKFDFGIQTFEDARQALRQLLHTPLTTRGGSAPKAIVLLDGLNEYAGSVEALLAEIRTLNTLEGLHIALSARTMPEGTAFTDVRLLPLEEQDVSEALARHRLLTPESADMQALLRLPMMLSLYIRTALDDQQQLQCASADELIAAYLAALCRQAAREAGAAAHYPTETAVKLVLPAIARRLRQSGAPLSGTELLDVVRECYRVVRSRLMLRAFPEWIGNRREILADAADEEAWYGVIVLQLLWKKLGLLRRDGEGRFTVTHQILGDYLASRFGDAPLRIRRRRRQLAAAAALLAAALLLGTAGVWKLYFSPIPYDQAASETVYDAAITQYVLLGQMYDAMTGMLDGDATPADCGFSLRLYGMPPYAFAQDDACRQLREAQTDRSVLPWSRTGFDLEADAALNALAARRLREYAVYCDMLAFAQEEARKAEAKPGYYVLDTVEGVTAAIRAKLEADADEAWCLYERVIAPHSDSLPEKKAQELQFRLLLVSPAFRNRVTAAERNGLAMAEVDAKIAQNNAKNAILSLGTGFLFGETLEQAWETE